MGFCPHRGDKENKMTSSYLKFGMASAIALTLAMPAVAQSVRETPESHRAQEVYEGQRQPYG
eukprot:gene32554-55049_t